MKRRLLAAVVILLGSIATVGVVYSIYAMSLFRFISPGPCSVPAPPIELRTASGSGELVFHAAYSTYRYSNKLEQAPISDLRYELAQYHQEDDHLGVGEIFREGRLDSLNTTGDFQFHDMANVGVFSASNAVNDFFILLSPPPLTVQLRIIDPTGKAIAWNLIVGCI